MTKPVYVFELLNAHHDLSQFVCEEAELTRFLQEDALRDGAADLSITTVVVEEGSRRVLGYFSLCNTTVHAKSLPPSEMAGLPKYPVPGILLARLARDISTKAKGAPLTMGDRLLVQAMKSALLVRRYSAWRFLTVHAYRPIVVPVYTKYGFEALPGKPLDLYLSRAKVAQVVDGFTQ